MITTDVLDMPKPTVNNEAPAFETMLPIIRPSLVEPAEMLGALTRMFSSGTVTAAAYVRRFEQSCAQYLGVEHAVAVSSATSGLILAVKALGLTGEVIVPSFTFTATVHSLVWNGITPVFADCEPGTYNIDPEDVERKMSSATSAIMPVYIFGNPPRIKWLSDIAMNRGLRLVFDSAQAFGAEYGGIRAGGFGDCEVFSLSPTKVLTAIEGGLITTNNPELAAWLRKARDYGKSGEDIECVGLSARMSEIHALVGLNNLARIRSHLERRHELIALYKERLHAIEGIGFQQVHRGNSSSGNYMVIFVDREKAGISRDELYDELKARNIQTKKYFYPAVHTQTAYARYGRKYAGKLPVTEKAAEQGLALPLYGHMDQTTVETVCLTVRRVIEDAQVQVA
jgi:dTDP-4-amino-4,6-dideoxygalactose transaminase